MHWSSRAKNKSTRLVAGYDGKFVMGATSGWLGAECLEFAALELT